MSKHKGKQQTRQPAKKSAPQKKAQSRRAQRKKNARTLSGKTLLLAGAVVVLGVAGFFGWPYLTPAPIVVHPASSSTLDPAVEALIQPMLAAAKNDPRDASVHAELGLAYEANGLWNEAQQSYDNALRLDNSNVDWHLHKAIAARQAGDFETALATLRDQSAKNLSSPHLQNHLGDALLEAGELAEAEKVFRNLIALSPSAAQGYAGLGDILIQKGSGKDAVTVLETAVQKNPAYKQAHYLLGRAYAMTGQEEAAQASLVRGVDSNIQYIRDPLSGKLDRYTVNVTGRISQASYLLDTGNPKQAAQLLEESYQYHNSNVMLLNTLSSAYLKTSRLDAAHRLLMRARELDENQFFTYLNLYTWALRSGKKEEALQFADEAIARAPERDDTHLARAQALTELDRLEEALPSAIKALEIDGNKAGNHGLVGDLYYRLEQYDKAETHLERALDLNSNLLPALVGLAQTKWALEKNEEARKLLNQAQQLAPNHPRIATLTRQFNGSL